MPIFLITNNNIERTAHWNDILFWNRGINLVRHVLSMCWSSKYTSLFLDQASKLKVFHFTTLWLVQLIPHWGYAPPSIKFPPLSSLHAFLVITLNRKLCYVLPTFQWSSHYSSDREWQESGTRHKTIQKRSQVLACYSLNVYLCFSLVLWAMLCLHCTPHHHWCSSRNSIHLD